MNIRSLICRRWLSLVACLLIPSLEHLRAATISTGDVTSALGPTFFVDDAVIGGDDVIITQPTVATYNRSFAGLLNANQGLSRVTLTGFGFATSTATTNNTASTLTVTFTYLGADEAVGGGDDVVIGSAAGTYAYTTNGEYVFAFDTPLTADLNITGTRFLIQVAPANDNNNGKVLFKSGALTYETTNGPKFSVSGIVAPQRVNLAKFQPVTTNSVDGQRLASYVTDGNAGNENRWQSSGSGPHWARVDFPFPVELGSAQVFTGIDDTLAQANFRIQYLDGTSWVDAPGAVITGNTAVERNIVFGSPVTAAAFRVYSTDGTLRIRELALYPPNGGAGFPLGTDVRLNLAQQRPAVASANTAGNFALLAVDGRVNRASMWQTSTAGSNSLDIDLIVNTKIGSAHLYSGSPGVAPLADFVLKYWDGSAWQDIPGGNVTVNTTADLVVSFTTPVTTSKVRLEFTNPGTTSVRELCIFPANIGNTGYPLGTDVTGAPPSTAQFDDYTDSFYQINNPAAGLFIAVNGSGQVALSEPGLSTGQGQYQIILNISTGTYRLRNRASGNCLSGSQLSKTPGQLLTDAPYSAMPHQDWILDPLDGGAFQLINQWSGLAIDIQGGGMDAGTPLVQNTANGSASQRWQAVYSAGFPKKGIGGTGTVGSKFGTAFNVNWMYGWGLASTAALPDGAVYHPMQWGNFNWTYNTTAASTWKLYPAWRTTSEPLQLMGFNEPDTFNQSGNSLDTFNTNEADFSLTRAMEKAVELWPRLQAMDLPLVAPCPANMSNGWLADFYTHANAQGYRVDYTAKHTYGGPGNGSSDGLVNGLLEGYTLWGKPMWLTEFSFVDWGGTSSWSEEDCYNSLAEFLWRAESLPWLRKYALFVFTEDANNPQPANPWQKFTPAPRSNSRDINGNMTAFGKLYAAWDNDASVRTDKTYYIHNKNTRKRLANLLASGPDGRSIRVDDSTARWTLVSTGASNRYYLVSSRDGRRLSYANSTITLAAAGTIGSAVEWSLTENQYGWYYLNHPSTSTRLQLAYNNTTSTATYSMVANTNTGDAGKWRFIVPPPPPTWSGAGDASWANAGNWTPGVIPATGDMVSFDSSSTANLDTVLNQDFNILGVSVSSPTGPVSIGGTHSLTIGGSGIDLADASQNLAITAPVVLGAAQSWSVGSGRTLSLGGVVSGSHEITVSGAGKVSLGAANLLPNGAGAGNLIVDGTLDLNGTSQSINSLSGGGIIDNTAAGASVLALGNNDEAITLNAILQNTNGTLALVRTGAGNLTLPAAQTYSGGFTNNGTGNVFPRDNAAFGTGPVVMNGSTLYSTAGSYTFANELTLNGATLRVGGSNNRSITWNGPVTATGTSGLSADGGTTGITLGNTLNIAGATFSSFANGTTNTINGSITGAGGNLNVTGGTLALDGANDYTGATTLSGAGVLRLQTTGTISGSGNVTINGSSNFVVRNTVGWVYSGTITGDGTGQVNLNTGTNATLAGDISGVASINANSAGTDATISGAISGTANVTVQGTVDVNGLGAVLRLGGSNNYSGSTTVSRGSLVLAASNVLPDSTPVSIGNATLDAASFSDTAGTLDVTNTATIALGTGAALAFADSSAVDWTGGSLNISGAFVSGFSLRFGTTGNGLTPAQLALITVNGGTDPLTLDDAGFLITAITDPYDIWKSQITNGLDLRTDDADGDGFTNFEEFLFGTTPITSNGSLSSTTKSGSNLIIRWKQRSTASEATYLLMESATLGNDWLLATGAIIEDDGAAADGYQPRKATIAIGADTKFFRVEVVEN